MLLGITREDAIAHPDETLKVLEFQANYQQGPSHTPAASNGTSHGNCRSQYLISSSFSPDPSS
jgi:hypothetical protein